MAHHLEAATSVWSAADLAAALPAPELAAEDAGSENLPPATEPQTARRVPSVHQLACRTCQQRASCCPQQDSRQVTKDHAPVASSHNAFAWRPQHGSTCGALDVLCRVHCCCAESSACVACWVLTARRAGRRCASRRCPCRRRPRRTSWRTRAARPPSRVRRPAGRRARAPCCTTHCQQVVF